MLTDNSLMPFGKHQGKKLVDVPGSYLLWLESNINLKNSNKRSLNEKELLKYIEENKQVLEMERKFGN